MSWFRESFLGVDIGSSSVKVVEIQIKDKKPILTNYAWMDLGGIVGTTAKQDTLKLILKRVTKEGGLKGKNAFASVSPAGSLIVIFELPAMAREDLDQAVKFEARKYVPVSSLEDVIINWEILNSVQKNSEEENSSEKNPENLKTNQILLVASSKNKVEKCEKIVTGAGLKLKSMEVENFSLVRSLVGNDQGNFIIVEIGSVICTIILVEKGVIRSSRNLDSGGEDVTRAISSSLQVDEARAEQMKLSGENFFRSNLRISLPSLGLIVAEIKKVLYNYYKTEEVHMVNGVILSGGTAGLKGIEEYFSENLRIQSFVGNPLGRVEYDRRLEEILEKNKNRFSVALGLALKGLEEQ